MKRFNVLKRTVIGMLSLLLVTGAMSADVGGSFGVRGNISAYAESKQNSIKFSGSRNYFNLCYGYSESERPVISVDVENDCNYKYQWYRSDRISIDSGEIISGAENKEYKVPVGLDIGNTYYYCAITDENNLTTVIPEIKIVSVIPKIEAQLAEGLVYREELTSHEPISQQLITGKSMIFPENIVDKGVMYYGISNSEKEKPAVWKTDFNELKRSDSDIYYVWCKFESEISENNVLPTCVGKVKIAPLVKEPQLETNLVYKLSESCNPQPQKLIKCAGSTSKGVMMYAVSKSDRNISDNDDVWKTDIEEITGNDADFYYVWYKVVTVGGLDENSEPECCEKPVEIRPQVNNPKINNNFAYDNEEHQFISEPALLTEPEQMKGTIFYTAVKRAGNCSETAFPAADAEWTEDYRELKGKDSGRYDIWYKVLSDGDKEFSPVFADTSTITLDISSAEIEYNETDENIVLKLNGTVLDKEYCNISKSNDNIFTVEGKEIYTGGFEGMIYDNVFFKPWDSENSLPTKGNYYLKKDVILDDTWNINEDVGLNLNGHAVRNSENFNSGESLIVVDNDAVFSLYDSKDNVKTEDNKHYFNTNENAPAQITETISDDYFFGGYVTSGKTAEKGGAVNIKSGRFMLESGTLFGNSAEYGGAVYLGGIYADFTMNGGSVTGNYAENCGGGIYAENDFDIKPNIKNLRYIIISSDFTINGGCISKNRACVSGGAIFLNNMILSISKNPEISGNTLCGNISDNIVFEGRSFLNIKGELSNRVPIGIFRNETGVFTESSDTDFNLSEKFVSDISGRTIVKNDFGQLEILTVSDNIRACFEFEGNVEPVVKVYDDSTELKKNTDYILSDFKSDGNKISVEVTFKGKYAGNKAVTLEFEYIPAKAATHTDDGNIEYWSYEGRNYIRENNKYMCADDITTPKVPADIKIRTYRVEPTYEKRGYICTEIYCAECGKLLAYKRTAIPKLDKSDIQSVIDNSVSFVYREPSAKVYQGNKIVASITGSVKNTDFEILRTGILYWNVSDTPEYDLTLENAEKYADVNKLSESASATKSGQIPDIGNGVTVRGYSVISCKGEEYVSYSDIEYYRFDDINKN